MISQSDPVRNSFPNGMAFRFPHRKEHFFEMTKKFFVHCTVHFSFSERMAMRVGLRAACRSLQRCSRAAAPIVARRMQSTFAC